VKLTTTIITHRANNKIMAKIALIVGSVRRDRQGIKVARWMNEKLKNRNHMVYFIDPLELNLPLLDRMYKEMADPSEE
jgi:NAD(P)H-dependent FMN reductase